MNCILGTTAVAFPAAKSARQVICDLSIQPSDLWYTPCVVYTTRCTTYVCQYSTFDG